MGKEVNKKPAGAASKKKPKAEKAPVKTPKRPRSVVKQIGGDKNGGTRRVRSRKFVSVCPCQHYRYVDGLGYN